ncbi:MAG: addiction module toxin, HicA family [Deltaproteobacteria bacterium]|nr:addiction module toxin, HicA family [Deltaproteobacteria bacterium]
MKLIGPCRSGGPCEKLREGGNHSVFWHTSTRKILTLPRYVEIADNLAQKICRDLGIPTP